MHTLMRGGDRHAGQLAAPQKFPSLHACLLHSPRSQSRLRSNSYPSMHTTRTAEIQLCAGPRTTTPSLCERPFDKLKEAAGRRRRVLSGVQPTGTLHLGNYLGAIRIGSRGALRSVTLTRIVQPEKDFKGLHLHVEIASCMQTLQDFQE